MHNMRHEIITLLGCLILFCIHVNLEFKNYPEMVKFLTRAYVHRRRKFKRGGAPSNATLSLLGKELQEAHLGDPIEGTSQTGGLVTNPIDPLLATLVYNVPVTKVVINAPKPASNVIEKIAPKQGPPHLSQHLKPKYATF